MCSVGSKQDKDIRKNRTCYAGLTKNKMTLLCMQNKNATRAVFLWHFQGSYKKYRATFPELFKRRAIQWMKD